MVSSTVYTADTCICCKWDADTDSNQPLTFGQLCGHIDYIIVILVVPRPTFSGQNTAKIDRNEWGLDKNRLILPVRHIYDFQN